MNWNEVKRLDLEITNVCNAMCPQCMRYPTSSNLLNPILETKRRWTLEETMRYLPPNDLSNIDSFLFNGNFGDFVSNNEALEIINYFYSIRPTAHFQINTNGSARNKEWWRELAKIKTLKINFALDGLEDTHNLYRRNTDFNTILENATAFIEAGGIAEWTMTLFEHNEHQLSECRELAKKLKFHNFTPRYSYRGTTLVSENKKPLYIIKQAKSLKVEDKPRIPLDINIIEKIEESLTNKTLKTNQSNLCVPLNSNSDCMSHSEKSIFIGADWFVSPCCYLGFLGYDNKYHWGYDDFISKLKEESIDYADLYVTGDNTVKNVLNIKWIYDRLLTDNILTVCTKNCHKIESPVQLTNEENKHLKDKY